MTNRKLPRRRPPKLVPGTSVRVRALGAGAELNGDLGLVAREDVWSGHYIVRLDQPARYENADGSTEYLDEVRVAADNLEVLEVPSGGPLTPHEVALESIARAQESGLRISRFARVRLQDGRRAVALYFDEDRPDVRDLGRVHQLEGDGTSVIRCNFYTGSDQVGPFGFVLVWVDVLRPVRCHFHLVFDLSRHRDLLYGMAVTGRVTVGQWIEGMVPGAHTYYGIVWDLGPTGDTLREQLEKTAATFDDPVFVARRQHWWASESADSQVLALV